MARILVLYYSATGNTADMARQVARGVETVGDCEAVLRTVPRLSPIDAPAQSSIPDAGAPYADRSDVAQCDGLILGSPTRFGNMAAPLKAFVDSLSNEWLSGTLVGKPAGLFTSTGSPHGGQEATLLSMMIPLLHHGMVISGVPYTEPALMQTQAGGTPYGPSHYSGDGGRRGLDDAEKQICRHLGARIARLATRLADD